MRCRRTECWWSNGPSPKAAVKRVLVLSTLQWLVVLTALPVVGDSGVRERASDSAVPIHFANDSGWMITGLEVGFAPVATDQRSHSPKKRELWKEIALPEGGVPPAGAADLSGVPRGEVTLRVRNERGEVCTIRRFLIATSSPFELHDEMIGGCQQRLIETPSVAPRAAAARE